MPDNDSSPHPPDIVPQWCFDKFDEILERIEQTRVENKAMVAQLTAQIIENQGVLVGDKMHPNGLVLKVRDLEEEMRRMSREWIEFKAAARGLAVGIATGAGLVGGGIAAAVSALLGG